MLHWSDYASQKNQKPRMKKKVSQRMQCGNFGLGRDSRKEIRK